MGSSRKVTVKAHLIRHFLRISERKGQAGHTGLDIASIIETCLRLGVNTSAVLREICAEGLLRGEVTLQLPLGNRLPAPAL